MNRLVISTGVLDQARTFFEDCGARGREGTAMIAQTAAGDTKLVIPDQRAGRAPQCFVEVTEKGKLDLAVGLGAKEQYVARIHSHPVEAFHSATDDANPALTHDGALSIVVPFFGLGLRHGLDSCAVYRLLGGRWIEIPAGALRNWHVVTQ